MILQVKGLKKGQSHVKSAGALLGEDKTVWWFQPIWKILVKLEIFPK